MNQKKLIAIALLALGVVLVLFGFNQADAPTEKISEAVTGRYSDQTMMYLIGGSVAAIVGLVMLLKK